LDRRSTAPGNATAVREVGRERSRQKAGEPGQGPSGPNRRRARPVCPKTIIGTRGQAVGVLPTEPAKCCSTVRLGRAVSSPKRLPLPDRLAEKEAKMTPGRAGERGLVMRFHLAIRGTPVISVAIVHDTRHGNYSPSGLIQDPFVGTFQGIFSVHWHEAHRGRQPPKSWRTKAYWMARIVAARFIAVTLSTLALKKCRGREQTSYTA
jgi:hypothetical protein